jgi:hypothetical protein
VVGDGVFGIELDYRSATFDAQVMVLVVETIALAIAPSGR